MEGNNFVALKDSFNFRLHSSVESRQLIVSFRNEVFVDSGLFRFDDAINAENIAFDVSTLEFACITTSIESEDIRSRLLPCFSFTTALEVEVPVSTNKERTSSSFRAFHYRLIPLDLLNYTSLRVSKPSIGWNRCCTCLVGVDSVVVSILRCVMPSESNISCLLIAPWLEVKIIIADLFTNATRPGSLGFKDNGLCDAWASREFHASGDNSLNIVNLTTMPLLLVPIV